MLANSSGLDQATEQVLGELTRLRRFAGAPAEFWPAYLSAAARLAGASRGILILRDANQPERLKKLCDWSDNGHADRSVLSFHRVLPDLTRQTIENGQASLLVEKGPVSGAHHFAIGVALPLLGTQEKCVAGLLILNSSEAAVQEKIVRLQLASDVPQAYQTNQTAFQARSDVEKFASVLDVLVQLNGQTQFQAATQTLCNGLAERLAADRVSVGWVDNNAVRLRAISHKDRFEKAEPIVTALETVMDEALDQNDEVLWPAPDGATVVAREHENFAKQNGVGQIISFPLRVEDKVVGILTCERQSKPFTPLELQQVRLLCDQVARRLGDLKRQDRWFGARWASGLRERAPQWLGPERMWTKVLTVAGILVAVLLLLPIVPYRVEGNFILRSEEVSFLTAPQDGFIQTVNVRPGDVVDAGAPLVKLNTDDLELAEAEAVADQIRYLREAEKARANQQLAEMRIAQALADQSKARLDQVRHRIQQAQLRAPFRGVVVEGDLRQRIGSPVKQGDALIRMARIDALYGEAEIHERDVHEILDRRMGQIAFVTQPKLKFPVRIERIEPAAVPKEGENVFLARLALSGAIEPWWRPGMSGICKVEVEKRTLLWILTHRTVDFLRMFLWW
ncbi:MAG: HlyD family efflux transporter periplasmic adaptor subunit [Verrucomicrobiota bacterium]